MSDETLLQPAGQAAPVAETPKLLSGSVVGHYEILGPIGAGGMGAVYRARDLRLGRVVALKLKKPAADGQTSCRLYCTILMREGQAMGQLAHPNVLAIYDVGILRGCVYLALEYVEGATLRDWGAGARAFAGRLDAVIAAGRGLVAAHAAGVIHRDFKPDNVLVGDGVVKVADFGLARTRAQVLDWGVSCGGCGTEDAAVELARSIDDDAAGTPRYMAPEQLAGEAATALSDQYAFGIVAREVLGGRYPYDATTLGELRVARDAGRILDPIDPVPAPVLAVLDRCMQRDPAARFPAMSDVLDALAAA